MDRENEVKKADSKVRNCVVIYLHNEGYVKPYEDDSTLLQGPK